MIKWPSKTHKAIFYAYGYGALAKNLAMIYGWRSVRLVLKQHFKGFK